MKIPFHVLAAWLLMLMMAFIAASHAQGMQSPHYSPEQIREMHRQYCITMSEGQPDRGAWIERCLAER